MGKSAYKANHDKVTKEFLDSRISKTYQEQKWIQFCRFFLDRGFEVYLYEAKKTFSKYITIKKGDKKCKVRFSNHRPNAQKEKGNDCDFWVGVCNYTVNTTESVIKKVLCYFDSKESETNG